VKHFSELASLCEREKQAAVKLRFRRSPNFSELSAQADAKRATAPVAGVDRIIRAGTNRPREFRIEEILRAQLELPVLAQSLRAAGNILV